MIPSPTQTLTIPRDALLGAIETGIEAAGLTGTEAEALREVGRTALVVGGNYFTVQGPKCPWSTAFPWWSADDTSEAEIDFIEAFDAAIDAMFGASTFERIVRSRTVFEVVA